MKQVLEKYRKEISIELEEILSYWMKFAVDERGGFMGRITHENDADLNAPKGSVLNSRILWSFSAAYNLKKSNQYLSYAERAFTYLKDHFIDKDFGGVWWTVKAN